MSEFERYRPLLAGFFLGLMLMAVNFGYVVWTGGSPIKEETYGAAVWAFPALWWCGIQLGGAMAACVGYLLRIRWLAAIGALICAAVFSAFSVLAAHASDGILLYTSSIYVAVPFSLFAAWRALGRGDGR